MALFVLKQGYRVTTTPKGGCVVHIRTGDTLELNALELHVLARSTAGGIDASDERVKGIVKKLTNLGLLVRAPPTPRSPGVVPTFDELTLDVDTPLAEVKTAASVPPPGPLPRFRGGLKVVKHPGTNLSDIIDPVTNQSLSVHDFELSLARMLDGKRTYSQVFSAAERLGIPVNPDSLLQFLKQLSSSGFIAPPGSVELEPHSTFPSRDTWHPSVRENFQAGLRLRREGRYPEAISAFELVLSRDPENPEAKDALAAVRRTLSEAQPAAASPAPTAESSPAPATAATDAPPITSSASVFELDVSSFTASGQAEAARTPAVAPTHSAPLPQPPLQAAPLPEVVTPRRSVSLPLYLASLVAAAALGWFAATRLGAENQVPSAPVAALPPQPTQAQPDAGVEPPAATALVTPLTAEPAAAVPPTADVALDAGAMMTLVFDAGPPAPSPAREQPIDAGAPLSGDSGVAGPPAEAPVPGLSTTWTTARIIKRGRVTMETITAAADGTPRWSAKKLAEVKRGAVVGSLVTPSGRIELVAHKAGLFMPSVADGEAVKAEAELALIVYPQGFIQASVELAKLPAAWACEVSDRATLQTAPCTVVTATPRANGFSITATTDPVWFDSCDKPQLQLGEAAVETP